MIFTPQRHFAVAATLLPPPIALPILLRHYGATLMPRCVYALMRYAIADAA